jgi:ribosomal protein L37AE/L43A
MPQLIIVERIDGTAVAWRCSDCRQNFSARGKLSAQERQKKVTAEFKAHIERDHMPEPAGGTAFTAGVSLPS